MSDKEEDLKSLLLKIMGDPELQDLLRESLSIPTPKQDSEPTGPPKTEMKVIDQYNGDVTDADMRQASQIKVSENRTARRRPATMEKRSCGCGRTEWVVVGSPTDIRPFRCNNCML